MGWTANFIDIFERIFSNRMLLTIFICGLWSYFIIKRNFAGKSQVEEQIAKYGGLIYIFLAIFLSVLNMILNVYN